MSITTNVKSRLLSDQENEAIFRIIGRRCVVSALPLFEKSVNTCNILTIVV